MRLRDCGDGFLRLNISGRVFCNLAQMFDILWTSEANELNKMGTEDKDLSASVIVL